MTLSPRSGIRLCLGWLLASPIFGVLLFWLTGQYKGLTRYVGSRSFYQLALANGLLMLLLLAFGEFFRLPSPPRSCWLLFWLCATGLCGLMRFSLRDVSLEDFPCVDRQIANPL